MADYLPVEIGPLGPHHDRGDFLCGADFIDRFFAKRCLEAHGLYKVRAYVATEPGCTQALGFYTLSLASLKPDDTSPDEAHAKFGTWAIPLVYLGQIGVHRPFQNGRGIGSAMMYDAFERTLEIAELAGTFGLALDAIDEQRAEWYEGLAFQRFDVEQDGRIKMICPLSTIRAALQL